MFNRLGYPVSLTADNERQPINEEFKCFCKECGIRLLTLFLIDLLKGV